MTVRACTVHAACLLLHGRLTLQPLLSMLHASGVHVHPCCMGLKICMLQRLLHAHGACNPIQHTCCRKGCQPWCLPCGTARRWGIAAACSPAPAAPARGCVPRTPPALPWLRAAGASRRRLQMSTGIVLASRRRGDDGQRVASPGQSALTNPVAAAAGDSLCGDVNLCACMNELALCASSPRYTCGSRSIDRSLKRKRQNAGDFHWVPSHSWTAVYSSSPKETVNVTGPTAGQRACSFGLGLR